MPHQCTNCGHTFPDGSKEMLSGCPECGGNKFQFKPAGSNADSVADETTTTADSTDVADASTGASATPEAETPSAGRQTSPPETEGSSSDAEVVTSETPDSAAEAPAQSTARSDVVDSSELTAAGSMGPKSGAAEDPGVDAEASASQPTADQPAGDGSEESNLDQLRKELNDQFESIRIVSPGQYELNLMELYDREEYIISLREDGRYVIEVPDGWGDS